MHLKNFFAAVSVLLLSTLIGACEPSPSNNGKLNIGVSPDYPPFEFLRDGKVVGIDIDIMEAVAHELGRELVVHDMAFDTLIAALQSGRIDAAASSLTVTEERLKHVDFSNIYYKTTLVVLSTQDHPYTKVEEMVDKVVGVQTGSIMESYLKSKAEPLKIDVFSISNNRLLVEELRLGRIDAVILEQAQAKEFVAMNPGMKYYLLEPTDNGYAIAFRKGNKLKDEVNAALQKLEKEGELENVKRKWFK